MTNRITARRVTYGSPTLDASRAALLFGTALGVSIAIFAAAPQQAWAADECGADVGGVATCTSVSGVGNPYPTGIDYVADAGEDIIVVLDPTVVVTSGFDDGVTAFNANVGYNSVIVVQGGAVITTNSDGVLSSAFAGGGAGYAYNDGTITAGTRGVFAYGADDAYATNTGSITVNGAANPGTYAIGVIANGGDVSSINNSGDVTVTGGLNDFAVGLYAYQATTALVVSSGAVEVDSSGTGVAYGIAATSIGGATTVTTTAGGSVDVYASGTGDATGIDLDADAGASATANIGDDISAISFGGSATGINATATTTIDIDVVGDIYTDIDNTVGTNYGISAVTGADATDAIDIDVVGDITTQDGSTAMGIFASGGGAITIDVAGSIDVVQGVDGVAYGWGVYAINTGGSSITINVDDVSVDQAGSFLFGGGDGINAYTVGVTDITAEDVSTTGYYADGIRVGGAGGIGGDTDIDVVSVTTTGYGSDGIDVGAANGFIDVTATGAITTTGTANASGLELNAGENIVVNVTSVSTDGTTSDGIYAYAQTGVDITATSIDTDGADSDGIEAYTAGGLLDIDVVNIDTDGASALGIDAYNVAGDIDITVTGTVDTAGAGSTGIYAFSFLGATTVDAGTVITAGANAYGIFAYGDDDVNVTAGSVTTTGAGSVGIYAYSFIGATYVYAGTVSTIGAGATGIYAYGYDSVYVGANSVTTTGANAIGIEAYAFGGVTVESALVVTSGSSSTGISAISLTDYVYVDSGTVNTTGDAADGIYAASFGSDTTDYVTVNSDVITTDGLGSDGLVAYTYYGDITIYSGAITTLGDDSYGIFAYANNTGNIYIDSGSIDTSGANSTGIYAYAFYGTSTVYSFDVDTDGDNSIGIYNYGFTGAYVDSSFVQTDGVFSAGIVNLANYGLATVDSFIVDTNGDDSPGIVSVGFSGSAVESGFVTTDGDRSDGIISVSTGGSLASVYSYSVVTTGAYSDGIVAIGQGYYDSGTATAYAGSVYVDSGYVSTSGYNAYGIYAAAIGGDVDVFSNSVVTTGDFSTGIYAAALNYYDSGNLLNLQGDVYVNSSFVETSGLASDGIFAYAEGGNVTVLSGTVITNGDFSNGIDALAAYYLDPVLLTYYSGDVLVRADNVYTYGDFSDGIFASAQGGNVTVYADDVMAFGLDSDAIVAVTGGLDVNNSNDVYVETTGTIYSADGIGISIASAGGAVVDVDSGSVYGYDWGVQSTSVDGTYVDNDGYIYGGEGRAIDIDGGAAEIFNGGTILGFIDLTDNADYLYNNGLWEAYGTSSFGLGVDEVVNEGTVGFSRYQGAASTTTFAGLEFFSNYGTVSGVDGQVGDVMSMPGTAFFGGAGSELDLDVALGGPGSTADRLVIGSASGVTRIDPFDTLAGSPGVLNFGGILVVDSANAAELGTEFVMDNVDKGWVEYELFFDAANDNWLIVGLPDDEVFEMLAVMSGAQDFWSRSGDALTARWQEIRDASPDGGASAGPGGLGRSDGWELWMQAHAGDEEFEDVETFSFGGFNFTQDLATDSDWRGFQFGFDNLQGNTLWGLTMGFTQQETNLTATSNSFDLEGWNVGAYAGWASNGFFLNGLLKGDFYSVDGNFRTLPDYFSFDGVTWGAKAELGYRWEGQTLFFEPIASIAWTTTDLDGFTTSGATIEFDDADSLVGKAGARIGGTFGSGNVVWTPYIGAYAVEEFEGTNGLSFTSGPTTIDFADTERQGYGQVDFGITGQTFYGLEGFVKGHWNFGGDADGGGVRMGARWRW